jgi:hypothetical protein
VSEILRDATVNFGMAATLPTAAVHRIVSFAAIDPAGAATSRLTVADWVHAGFAILAEEASQR